MSSNYRLVRFPRFCRIRCIRLRRSPITSTFAIRVVTGTAIALLAAACGGNVRVRTQSAPDLSFGNRSTFRILPVPARGDGVKLSADDPMLDNSITNRALREQVRRDLEARGYRAATGGSADFNVALYAAAKQTLDVRHYNYGYTWRGWPRQYTEVTPYERGTVIVDAVDPGTHRLLWRGQGQAAVSDDPNHFVRDAEKEVDAIVKKFPAPGH
jgi:hypothetical protein